MNRDEQRREGNTTRWWELKRRFEAVIIDERKEEKED